jgi:hypothetical protein
MSYLKNFLLFWYDFIVGDDWAIAVGIVAALGLTAFLLRRGLEAWWLTPAAVAILLMVSLWRATRAPR